MKINSLSSPATTSDPQELRPVAEHVRAAAEFVTAAFPEALGALLGGSSARGTADADSDLDIVVLLADDGISRRETRVHEGRVVELQLYSRADLRTVFATERTGRQAILLTICAASVPVYDPHGHAAALREEARALHQAGTAALSPAEQDFGRYLLTAVLEDLLKSTARGDDRHQQLAIADRILREAMMVLSAHRQAWAGSGKWLPRSLLTADPVLGRTLLDGHLALVDSGDPKPLSDAVHSLLDLLGGPLREGYVQTWRRPAIPRI
jgi:predicted nucleotidyltransferase